MTIYKDLKIGSSVNGTSQRYTYNITSSVSSVSGADANGNTLAYDSGFADVYLNGVRLSGADITITSGNAVSFASNLSNGDVVDIVAYGAFTVASVNADNLSSGTVPDARITGAYTGITNLTMSGDLTVDTDTLFVDSSNNRVGIGTNSPGFDFVVKDASGACTIRAENGADNKIVDLIADSTGGLLRTIGSYPLVFNTNQTERGRFDASGNFLVGTTSANPGIGNTNTGFSVTNGGGQVGNIAISQNGNYSANFNRNTSDGNVVQISKDGTVKHVITTTRMGIGNGNPQNKLDISALTWDDGILIKNTGNFNTGIIADANRTGAGGGILNLQGRWNGTEVTSILLQTGSDTTNKDDGEIVFRTASAGTPTERLRITSAGSVGIGTSSPQAVTEIVGGTGDIKALRLRTGDSTAGNNSGIDFQVLSSPTQGNRSSKITLDADGANSTGSDYFQFVKNGGSNQKIFFPSNDLIFEGSSEHVRITSAGRVGIGETSPDTTFHVNGGSTVAKFERDSGTNGSLTIGFPSTRATFDASGDLSIRNGGTERVRFHSGGIISATQGIALGVGTANTASNVLDDYEEGTWTPAVNSASGFSTGATNYSGTSAPRYTKIGNRVFLQAQVQMGNSSGNVALDDNIVITGLPFTPADVERNTVTEYRYNNNVAYMSSYLTSSGSILSVVRFLKGTTLRNGGSINININYTV
ncbi:hypothetical protein Kolga_gp18 [Pelagibacter phage Kolga EXVC016S]|nr:hypothetical protein Kolga_gp18 [Pelagibacter phage Kolga EXVC016S]